MRASRIVDGKPVITEKAMGEWIRKAAILNGYMAYHTWNSLRSAAGFPDWVLVNPKKHRLLFVELKTEKGKVTEKQAEWLAALGEVGQVDVMTVRPADFDNLFEELKR